LFVYDGWNLIAELTEVSGQMSVVRSHVWGLDLSGTEQGAGGVGGLLFTTSHLPLASSHFACFDGNGNVTALVDSATGNVAATYEYDPFGNLIARIENPASSIQNPFLFSTKYFDAETGLLYYGYRYYQPSTGRWLSRDPIGERGGKHLYSGMRNNPVNRVDLLGNLSAETEQTAREFGLGFIIDVVKWFAGQPTRLSNPRSQAAYDFSQDTVRNVGGTGAVIAGAVAYVATGEEKYEPFATATKQMVTAIPPALGHAALNPIDTIHGIKLDMIGGNPHADPEYQKTYFVLSAVLFLAPEFRCRGGTLRFADEGLAGSRAYIEAGSFKYNYTYVTRSGKAVGSGEWDWWTNYGKLEFGPPRTTINWTQSADQVLRTLTHEGVHEKVFTLSPQLSHMKTVPVAGGYFRLAEEVGAYGWESWKHGFDVMVVRGVYESTWPELSLSQKIGLGAGVGTGLYLGWQGVSDD
jgi:RHS repeat-associated protein